MDSFDPWKLAFVKTIDSFLEQMDPESVAPKCAEKGLITKFASDEIMRLHPVTGRKTTNNKLISQVQGTGIKGYQAFKQILSGNPQHKGLVERLEQKEREELTRDQLNVLEEGDLR